MTVIDDESVINSFVRRKHFLQSAKAGAGHGMVQKNSPGPVQHPDAATLAHFQGFVTGKALNGAPYAEPRHQGNGQNNNQARSGKFLPFSAPKKNQDSK